MTYPILMDKYPKFAANERKCTSVYNDHKPRALQAYVQPCGTPLLRVRVQHVTRTPDTVTDRGRDILHTNVGFCPARPPAIILARGCVLPLDGTGRSNWGAYIMSRHGHPL